MNAEKFDVPALARGMAILEFLAQHPEGKALSDIAESLGFPFSSVSRTTLQLESMGYLQRKPDSKLFCHTMKMLLVGQRALSEFDLVGTALPVMRRLRNALCDTVALGVLNDDQIIVIESAPGTHLFKFSLDIGHRINIPASAPGKAILAFLPPEQQSIALSRIRFQRFNERTIANLADFRRELAEVRRLGYALDCGEEYSGIYCAGVPLLDRNGFPIAAIWVTGPDVRVKPEALPGIGERIRSGAAEISKILGYGQI